MTPNLILIFLCLSASALLIYQAKHFRTALQSYFWKKTFASIVNYKVEVETHEEGNFCTEKIQYDYFINGKKYQSNKIGFFPSNYLCAKSQNSPSVLLLEKHYINNEKIEVFYDPKTPENAVIKNGICNHTCQIILWLGIFLGTVIFNIFLMVGY